MIVEGWLRFSQPDGRVWEVALVGPVLCGRYTSCDVVLQDPDVSRYHARFCVVAGGLTVEDLGSAGGTFLDGLRLAPSLPYTVPAGSVITLGSTTVTYTPNFHPRDLVPSAAAPSAAAEPGPATLPTSSGVDEPVLGAPSGQAEVEPSDTSLALPLEDEGAADRIKGGLRRVWFGTNRERANGDRVAFSVTRSSETSYGYCDVFVPTTHRFGSLGSPWWRRWLRREDDRLKLRKTVVLAQTSFWKGVTKQASRAGVANLVFIHGFNVDFSEAALRTAQIAHDLKISGASGFFSWPSAGVTASYLADGASIEASEELLKAFLVAFAKCAGPSPVHVIAHSMGNRGLLRALQRIVSDAASSSDFTLGQIFLAAPDMDADLFRTLLEILPPVGRRITLYASPADKAVGLSGVLHTAPRAGFLPPVTVVRGVDTIAVTQFNLLDLGHGYYASAAGVLHDMFDLIQRDAPPDQRQRVSPSTTPEGLGYWVIR